MRQGKQSKAKKKHTQGLLLCILVSGMQITEFGIASSKILTIPRYLNRYNKSDFKLYNTRAATNEPMKICISFSPMVQFGIDER